MFPWDKTTEERMLSEIRSELEIYRKRCEALHEEFRKKLRSRDEARAALAEADEKIKSLQMESVALLGNLNTAMSGDAKEELKDLERSSKRNTRDLIRAQKTRDATARKLKAIEVDDEKAVSDLKNAVSEVLDEYAECVRERKQRLTGLMESLDKNQEALARDVAPLTGEYEPRRPREELPAAEKRSQED